MGWYEVFSMASIGGNATSLLSDTHRDLVYRAQGRG
jgi:hypothetical protein